MSFLTRFYYFLGLKHYAQILTVYFFMVGMEFRTNSSKGHDKAKKTEKTRRVWTTKRGRNSPSSIEGSYQSWLEERKWISNWLFEFLEDAMKKTFPNTDLQGQSPYQFKNSFMEKVSWYIDDTAKQERNRIEMKLKK